MIRVTCYLTKGGIRHEGDPVAWTADMTVDAYDAWLAKATEQVERDLARHAERERRASAPRYPFYQGRK